MTKTIVVGAPSGRNCQLDLGWSPRETNWCRKRWRICDFPLPSTPEAAPWARCIICLP